MSFEEIDYKMGQDTKTASILYIVLKGTGGKLRLAENFCVERKKVMRFTQLCEKRGYRFVGDFRDVRLRMRGTPGKECLFM